MSQLKWPMIVLLGVLAGCSDDDDDDDDDPDPSQVRVINLVDGSPTLRFELDSIQLGDVSYGQASSLTDVENETYDLTVSYFDADGDDEIEIIEEEEVRVRLEDELTLIVTGALESPVLTELELPLVDLDDTGTAELLYFHGASSRSAVDIYLSSDPDSTSINGISPIALNVGESTDLTPADGGSYRLLVTESGSSELIFDSGEFDINAETRRLFMTTNYFGPGGDLRMVRINQESASNFIDEGFPTALRIANMIPDEAEVDILFNGEEVAADLEFGRFSDYIELDPSLVDIEITLPDQPLAVLYDDDRQLISGEFRTLVVTGLSASNQVTGRFFLDEQRRIETAARLSIVNASPGTGNLDAYLLLPGQSVEDIDPVFTNLTLLTNGTDLVEGRTYDLVFTRAEEETIVLGPERLTLINGGIYTVVISDADGGGTPSDIVLTGDFAR